VRSLELHHEGDAGVAFLKARNLALAVANGSASWGLRVPARPV
jgi:hypothetical protein